MILAFLLIGMVWLWFQFELIAFLCIGFVIFVVLLFTTKILRLAFLVCSIIVLTQLEFSLDHVLTRGFQHQVVEGTFCLEGRVRNYDDGLQSFNASLESPIDGLSLRTVKVWNNVESDADVLKTGDCFAGAVRVKQPLGRIIPGSFHADRYHFSQRIDAIASVKEIHEISFKPNLSESLFLKREKEFITEQGAQYWSALMFGWSSALDTETKALLIDNQIMHLFVISGMHLGFIVLMFSLFIAAISSLLSPWHQISLFARRIFVFSLALAYVAFLGFPLPAFRALIMIGIPYLGTILNTRFNTLDILGFAAVILTLIWPEAWLGLGAWLSFSSVLIILLLLRWQVLKNKNWFLKVLFFESFLLLGSIPWAFLAGLKVNAFSIVLNFALTPIIAFIALPLAAILAFTSPPWLVWIWERLFQAIEAGLSFSAIASFAVQYFDWPLVLVLVAFVSAGLWERTKVSATAIIVVAILILISGINPKKTLDGLQLSVLDVGHGQAILIEQDGRNVLYDTGGYFTPDVSLFESTLNRLLPTLHEVIVSHSDSDHSAGLSYLLDKYPRTRIWTGQNASHLTQNQIVSCHLFNQISGSLQFIPIPVSLRSNDNDHSCILVIKEGKETVVITGDAGRRIEYFLLQEFPDLFPATVVVLGHHGSDTSSAVDWLNIHENSVFLVSSGDRSMPKWPGKQVSQWFESKGKRLNNTAEQGSIRLFIKDGEVTLRNWNSAFRQRLIY